MLSFIMVVRLSKSPKSIVVNIVLIVVIILAVGAIAFGVKQLNSPQIKVYDLQITNYSPSSATIVWRTDKPARSGVLLVDSVQASWWQYLQAYFKKERYWDDRDLEEVDLNRYKKVESGKYYTHHVTIRDLQSNQTYYFALLNNWGVGQEDLVSFTTTRVFDKVRHPAPVYGVVESTELDTQDIVVTGHIVAKDGMELNRERSSLTSTVLNDNSYVLDVATLYNNDRSELFSSLLDDKEKWTLQFTVLTSAGKLEYLVDNDKFQPVDTLTVYKSNLQTKEEQSSSWWLKFLSSASAGHCNSHCEGDCYGCNDYTEGNPDCISYGCGYMSYCCGKDECSNHCTNGSQDCNETGVDCGGGGCATCGKGEPQSDGKCKKYGDPSSSVDPNPVTGKCTCAVNKKQDADETGVDCGGNYCPSCELSQAVKKKKEEGVGVQYEKDEGPVNQEGEPATTTGGTSTAGQVVREGAKTCTYWDCLYACTEYVNGQPKTYIHQRTSEPECPPIAGDINVSWYRPTHNPWRNSHPGIEGYITEHGKTSVCLHIHTWHGETWGGRQGKDMPTEHEEVCHYGTGGQAGVSQSDSSLLPKEPEQMAHVYGLTTKKEEDLEPGVYLVDGKNVDITTKTVEVYKPGTMRYYYDNNQNGQQDPGELFLSDADAQNVEVELKKQAEVASYQMQKGWNSISFPIYTEETGGSNMKKASDLVEHFDKNGVEVNHVATYRNEDFIIYSERTDESDQDHVFGNDFDIVPGEGYFIKVAGGGDVAIAGKYVEGGLPVVLGNNWNLVGLYHSDKESYKAFAVLDQMKNQSIPADILTRWENNLYDSVVYTDRKYGQNYNVYPKQAYWVRVKFDEAQQTKKFTPN